MSLFASVSAESISGTDLEFHQIALKTLPIRSRQISRFRCACPLDLRALRISQLRLQPLQNDFLVVLRIFTIDRRVRGELDFGRLRPDVGPANPNRRSSAIVFIPRKLMNDSGEVERQRHRPQFPNPKLQIPSNGSNPKFQNGGLNYVSWWNRNASLDNQSGPLP